LAANADLHRTYTTAWVDRRRPSRPSVVCFLRAYGSQKRRIQVEIMPSLLIEGSIVLRYCARLLRAWPRFAVNPTYYDHYNDCEDSRYASKKPRK
jgi:hypothetical protein